VSDEETIVAESKEPQPKQGPIIEASTQDFRPRRKRGIMRSFFSHIIFAALAVVAVGGYFHWEEILSKVGGRVCAYDTLGRYGSSTKPVVLGNGQKAENTVAQAVGDNNANSDAEKKTVNESQGSEAKAAPEKSMQEAWMDARRVYQDGDKNGAITTYLALIEKYPNQADFKGELGNIYAEAGQQKQAAVQFYDAGVIWIKFGKTQRVKDIIKLLRQLDPAKSESLRLALEKAG
jgi:hypothetical protein